MDNIKIKACGNHHIKTDNKYLLLLNLQLI
jgi:hypothetical protein